MPSKDISELYFLKRYPQHSVGLFKFLLYLPFGLILMILRVLLCLQIFILGLILPDIIFTRRLLNKLLCVALGITINVENKRKENIQAFVSNSVTPFDHLVVYSVIGCATPGQHIFNSLITKACGFKVGPPLSNLTEFKKYVATSIEVGKIPLHFQPEHKQTTGKAVLKFETWYFNLCNQVQPICIQVNRPFLDLKVSCFNSSYWADALVYLFSPSTSYCITFLNVIDKMNFSEEEFAAEVQQNIASTLKVEVSEYSAVDLLEWEKRVIEDLTRREQENSYSSRSTLEINNMARQVKEVLPMVPLNTICTDLAKTRNVELTITNILEGRVIYTPESNPPSDAPSQSSTFKRKFVSKPSSSNNASVTFGKSPQERMLSFQERKQQLIETSRQRYIEKHGLNVVGSS